MSSYVPMRYDTVIEECMGDRVIHTYRIEKTLVMGVRDLPIMFGMKKENAVFLKSTFLLMIDFYLRGIMRVSWYLKIQCLKSKENGYKTK